MWKAMLDVSRVKEHVPIRDRNSIPRETKCQFIVYIVATSRDVNRMASGRGMGQTAWNSLRAANWSKNEDEQARQSGGDRGRLPYTALR